MISQKPQYVKSKAHILHGNQFFASLQSKSRPLPFSKTFILKENNVVGCKSKIPNRSVGLQNHKFERPAQTSSTYIV